MNLSLVQAQSLAVFVALLAAFGWPVTKIGLEYFDPFMFMGIRFFLVGCILAPFALRNFEWASFRASCLIGLTMIASTVLWVLGIDGAEDLGLAGFVIALGMIISPLYSHFFYNQPVDSSYRWRLLLAILGGLLMAPDFKLDNFVLFAAAALCFGWQITLISRQTQGADTITVSFGQMLTIGVGMLVLSALFEPLNQLNQAGWDGWLWVLGLGVGLTGLRFVLQVKAQKYLNHQNSSFLFNLESVFVLLVAAVIFDESHSLLALAGAALIFWAAVGRSLKFGRSET